MSVNVTNQFVDDLYALSKSNFPDAVVHQAKRCLLDYLGATFAGSRMMKEKGERLLSCFGQTPDSSVIGFNQKAGVDASTFINGLSSHIAELDDGVRFGMIHPGSPVLSALLPVAEKEKVSSTDLLKGIIIGYEAEVRLACAIQPSHYARGFHPTSTCGTIGAAMGVAAMLNFTRDEMSDALSAASVSSAGTLKVIEDGSEIKPLNVGRAAANGLMAAFVARAGFKGLDDALSGDTGFFAMMADEYDVAKLSKGKKEPFSIEKAYVKPYAACRHAHPAIEAALKIKAEKGISPEGVKELRVITYRGVIGKHDHTEIQGAPSAKMSIPYGLAVALVTGKAGIEQFNSEHASDPEILLLAKKVIVSADDEISALVPHQRAAIIEVLTNDGDCFSERVNFPKGEPENPMSDGEVEEKFRSLSGYGGRSESDISEMIAVIWTLEKESSALFQLL